MRRDAASKEEIAEEIRHKMRRDHGVELTLEETLHYMEIPEEYEPAAAAIEKFITGQVSLKERLKRTEVDCSVAHAIFMLRYPFTEQGRIGASAVARTNRDIREAREALTGESLHLSMNALPPR